MTNRTRYGIALGLVLLTVLVLLVVRLADRTAERNAKFERTFPVMGTVAKFTFYGPPEAAREAADGPAPRSTGWWSSAICTTPAASSRA